MKLLEFFGIIRENESNGTGKFVGARLTRDSERDITRWMRDNGLRKKEPRARMHITVIGDKEYNFPWNPATFSPPLEIDPSSYKIQKFDHGSIVLSFSVPELEKRHEQAIKDHAIQWDFPTYQPHITLSYDPTSMNNIERLLLPTFPLYVSHEYEQPWSFTESDSSTNRRRSARLDEAFLAERNLMNAPLAKKWAGHAAETLFGSERGAALLPMGLADPALKWAHRALARYFVNEIPAHQLQEFEVSEDPLGQPPNDGQLDGTGFVVSPAVDVADGGTGRPSGRRRSIVVPPWVPAVLERGDELYFLDQQGVNALVNGPVFSAVKDWFRYLANNYPEQLKTGALNRLSWQEAAQSAVAWHESMRANDTSDAEEDEGHREIYMEFGGGVAWWKLTGETCLTREGDLMGHCAADYVEDVASGDVTMLSLRDKNNNPHVTIELNENYKEDQRGSIDLAQIKGKGNQPPVEKYWKYVDELIKKISSSGTNLRVRGEGHEDLAGCDILEFGSMLIRTDPPLEEADSILNVVQYPDDREWSIYDHEAIPLWEALKDLADRDMLPDGTDRFGFKDDSQKIINYVKWSLLRNKEFDVDIRGHMDEMFFHDNPDFNRGNQDWVDEVPTHINIKVPDIKYEILSGTPEEFNFDIKHALAMRGSLT